LRVKSHCRNLLECCYVYVFTSRCDCYGMLRRNNSQGFWTPWWWLRLIGRNMLEWLNNNKLINPKFICAFFGLFFSSTIQESGCITNTGWSTSGIHNVIPVLNIRQ